MGGKMNDINSKPMEQPNVKTHKKKGCGSTILIIIIVSCMLVSVGGYLIYDQFVKEPEGLEVSVDLPQMAYDNETLRITLTLKNIAEDIILKDIVPRYNIKNSSAIKDLFCRYQRKKESMLNVRQDGILMVCR